MEIQKIFSDQYDEERYYSVLMNEDELAFYQEVFSEDEELDELKKERRKHGRYALGHGTAAGLNAYLAYSLGKHAKNSKGAGKLLSIAGSGLTGLNSAYYLKKGVDEIGEKKDILKKIRSIKKNKNK